MELEKQTEIWKQIEDTIYEVSNTGHVRNTLTSRVLALIKNKYRGYDSVQIKLNNRFVRFTIHRLVAKAFIDNPENKPQINHIDGNKRNNHASNLDWVTPSENMRHSYAIGLNMVTEERKEKSRIGNLGKIVTAETRAKLSKTSTGRVMTDEWRSNISKGNKGKNLGNQNAKKWN